MQNGLSAMTFDPAVLKVILSVFSIIGGTASGVAALLVEYKDKETGKITKWGRYALFGLAASFLVGTLNLWVDYTQKSRKFREAAERSREAAEKTLQIVTDISRTLNPLKDVRVSFWLSYPFDHPELAQYRQRLDEGVRALLPSLMKGDATLVKGVSRSVSKGDGTIMEVTIRKDSPLFPNRSSEGFAYTVLSNTHLSIYFYKTPIDLATLGGHLAPTPDISMGFKF